MSSKQDRMRKEADQWRKDKADTYKTYIKTSAVGLEVGLSVVVGIVAGFFADRYFDVAPWGIVVGFILGSAAAAKRLYSFAKQYLRDNPSDDSHSPPPQGRHSSTMLSGLKRKNDDRYDKN